MAGVEGDTIMMQPYPMADEALIDEQAETDIEWVKQMIVGVRNIRGEMNVSPAKALNVLLRNTSKDDERRLTDNRLFVSKLAKLESLELLEGEAPASATALIGEMEVLVPIAGVIDKDAELARLAKEIGKIEGELAKIAGKLGNEKFVANAPDAVVAKERNRQAQLESQLTKLTDQQTVIEQL